MKTVIYCATRSGNTRAVADAIADGLRPLGSVDVHALDGGRPDVPSDADLVLVGGPTEGHRATPAVLDFLEALPADALVGRAAAAFDTRVDWPRWLSGSAASDIAKKLNAHGARVVAEPESFIVSMKPELLPGELDRALAWGAALAGFVSPVPQVPRADRAGVGGAS
jgi:flavodoxin